MLKEGRKERTDGMDAVGSAEALCRESVTWNSVWLSSRLAPAWPSAVPCPCSRPLLASVCPSPGFCWPRLPPLPQITEAARLCLSLSFHFTSYLAHRPVTLPLGNRSDVLAGNVLFARILPKCVFCLDTYRFNLCKRDVLHDILVLTFLPRECAFKSLQLLLDI